MNNIHRKSDIKIFRKNDKNAYLGAFEKFDQIIALKKNRPLFVNYFAQGTLYITICLLPLTTSVRDKEK